MTNKDYAFDPKGKDYPNGTITRLADGRTIENRFRTQGARPETYWKISESLDKAKIPRAYYANRSPVGDQPYQLCKGTYVVEGTQFTDLQRFLKFLKTVTEEQLGKMKLR